ncbi:MAG TPA: ribosome small subunit-dependent GTPase A [Bacteroidales bacterium]|nr:ribosome small subunit-dependent GTPase A [Bacteroidales bacterium]
MFGTVVKSTGSWYTVKTDDGELIDCKIKGNFRMKDIRSTNPVAVGDRVEYVLSADDAAMIVGICDRKNYMIRRSSNLSKYSQILAANLDLVALVVTVNYPETFTVFIDRFLATAEAYRVPACLIINKIDRYDDDEMEYAESLKFLYENIGYPVFLISAYDESSLGDLKEFLKDKTTLMSGNSGVGKSTIINLLIPNMELRTGEISEYHNRGMHTTTFSEMFELPDGGSIIDTPGIKGFGTIDMDTYEVGHFFKEIFEFSKKCRFNNCTHIHEPDCAVLEALENHYISQSRYQSYLSILEDDENEKYR